MKRPANSENNLVRVRRWREICPDLTIRSTFIVGFPGETEADFEELIAFLEEARLDRVGCFAYSPVEGAAANALAHPVPDELKEARRERFMAVQERISTERLQLKVGLTLTVLVDEVDGGGAVGRSAADAPEIDGLVHMPRSRKLKTGEFAQVLIEDSDEHDLYGRPV
jgi:ribosomal protein S12 methylthiotransferase